LKDPEGKFAFGDYTWGDKGKIWPPEAEDRSKDAFWYVLDAAHRLQMLSPEFILEGYSAGHLVRIFNLLRQEQGINFRAIHFSELARLGKNHTFATIADCVLNDARSNAVIVNSNNHFYLATSFSDGFVSVLDSASHAGKKSKLTKGTIDSIRLSYCAAIVDETSSLVRCLQDIQP
jgi:hypothetical protein